MNKSKFVIVALSVLVIAGVVTVLKMGSGRRPTGSPDYKIGVLACLTGPAAQYGVELRNGAELAAADFESKTGKKVILVIEDTKSTPKDGLTAFNRLAEIEKIHFIVGDVLSGVVAALSEAASQKDVLIFAPGASTPALDGRNDNVFRNWVSDSFDAKVIADFSAKEGFKRVAVAYINNEYGKALAVAFEKRFTEKGGRVQLYPIPEDGSAGQDTVAKLLSEKPEALYVVGYAKNLGRLVRQIGESSGSIPFRLLANLVASEDEAKTLAGPYLDGIVFTDPSQSPPQEFVTKYKNRFTSPPGVVAAHSYDAMDILLTTLNNSPDHSVSGVKQMLSRVRDYPGVSGTTTLDLNGDASKPVYLKRLRLVNGTYKTDELGALQVSP